MRTQMITQSEAARAYPDILPRAGTYYVATTWTDENGERTGMVTGVGATADEAEANHDAEAGEYPAGGKCETWLVIPDDEGTVADVIEIIEQAEADATADRLAEMSVMDYATGRPLWTASLDGSGYGRCGQRKAHRVSWAITYGDIPEGMLVCHRCDTPQGRIVSPLAESEKTRTHCPRGHEYSPGNTIIHTKKGGRQCKACKSAHHIPYARERRRRQREAQHADL